MVILKYYIQLEVVLNIFWEKGISNHPIYLR